MSSDAERPLVRRNRRAVLDETGYLHPSILAAALARGTSPGYVYVKAKLQRGGWRFTDEAPRPPVVRPSRRDG